jgi:signal transduction histidine kinase
MYDFLREINAAGTTIILTTHYLEEAEALCRNMAIINHGKIVTNTSIRELLRDLTKESFVLDCLAPLPELISVTDFNVIKRDEHTIEVQIEKGQDLAQAFDGLREQGVKVLSMRNESNRLEQVFINLVTNAVDAMDDRCSQPECRQAEKKLTIKSFAQDGYVSVTVADTGSGMSDEVMRKIFEPFFTTKEKGSGIGLSISKQIMQLHGGNIFVKSEPNLKTSFILEF